MEQIGDVSRFLQENETEPGNAIKTILCAKSRKINIFFFSPEVLNESEIGESSKNADHSEDHSHGQMNYDDEDIELPEGMERPIYSGATCSIAEAVFLILQFYFEFQLTKKCLHGLLELINNFLPHPNILPRSKYSLLKILKKFAPQYNVKKHFYCHNKDCDGHSNSDFNISPTECSRCKTPFIPGKNFFVEFDLEVILRDLMEKEHMFKYFCKENHSSNGDIHDVCDGTEYAKLKSKGLFQSPFDFSLIMNTDGVPVFNSSNKQLWPVQFVVTELPIHLRKLFLIVGGVFFDSVKPNMQYFLKPFVKTLRKLATEGFSWMHPFKKIQIQSKVSVSLISVDAIARAPLQNMHQFNGSNGCSLCEQTGESIPEKHGYVYMPQFNNILRTGKRMERHATLAVQTQTIVMGIKGPSFLSAIPNFDLGRGFVPEYMHSALLGVTRQFLNKWFNPSNHNFDWYLGNYIDEMNLMLLSIQPTSCISRLPRSIKDRKYWKAAEFRSWLLFYSPVILKEFMPNELYHHWMQFVSLIFVLLRDKITAADIDFAQSLCVSFVTGTKDLYGPEHCTYNLHQVTHLPLAVQRWGPLWASSAFMFESNNGDIMKLLHGTQFILEQLSSFAQISCGFRVLKCKFKNSNVFKNSYSRTCLTDGTVLLGIGTKHTFIETELAALRNVMDELVETQCMKYYRYTIKHGITLSSKHYKEKQLRRNDYTI